MLEGWQDGISNKKSCFNYFATFGKQDFTIKISKVIINPTSVFKITKNSQTWTLFFTKQSVALFTI
jgi:hypothetical protein